ncbi:MAG: hypothetical protein RMK01_11875 [Thermomicrobium sp.]|nr:hypothetical protein [Thermomicrobium sp.]MDW8060761.1 hypothetical protein [Thermomicrobium sp.]
MASSVRRSTQRSRSLWRGPLASALVLSALFLLATTVRHSPWAAEGRPVMVALSSAAAVAIVLAGARTAAARQGWAGIAAGAVMVGMGLATLLHVLG